MALGTPPLLAGRRAFWFDIRMTGRFHSSAALSVASAGTPTTNHRPHGRSRRLPHPGLRDGPNLKPQGPCKLTTTPGSQQFLPAQRHLGSRCGVVPFGPRAVCVMLGPPNAFLLAPRARFGARHRRAILHASDASESSPRHAALPRPPRGANASLLSVPARHSRLSWVGAGDGREFALGRPRRILRKLPDGR
jgi:hypothetical protein